MRSQKWVVRVMKESKTSRLHIPIDLLVCLQYSGIMKEHDRCIDISVPVPTKDQAEMLAGKMTSYGYNAVAAPKWEDV